MTKSLFWIAALLACLTWWAWILSSILSWS